MKMKMKHLKIEKLVKCRKYVFLEKLLRELLRAHADDDESKAKENENFISGPSTS